VDPRPLADLVDRHADALADLEAHHADDLAAVWKRVGDDLERYQTRLWARIVGDRSTPATAEQVAEIRRRTLFRLRRLVARASAEQADVIARAVADAEVMDAVHARAELGAWDDSDG